MTSAGGVPCETCGNEADIVLDDTRPFCIDCRPTCYMTDCGGDAIGFVDGVPWCKWHIAEAWEQFHGVQHNPPGETFCGKYLRAIEALMTLNSTEKARG